MMYSGASIEMTRRGVYFYFTRVLFFFARCEMRKETLVHTIVLTMMLSFSGMRMRQREGLNVSKLFYDRRLIDLRLRYKNRLMY